MCDAGLIRAVGEIDLGTVDALRRELDAAREEVATVVLDLRASPSLTRPACIYCSRQAGIRRPPIGLWLCARLSSYSV
jgi:hypothetical protein